MCAFGALTILFFLGTAFIVWQYSSLVQELNEGVVSAAEAEAHQSSVYIYTAVLMLLVLGLSVSIISSVMGPLRRLQQDLAALSEGKYDTPVADRDHGDGIAAMARAAEFLRENSLETERLRAEAEQARVAKEEQDRKVADVQRAQEQLRLEEEKAAAQTAAEERQQLQDDLAHTFEQEISGVIQSLSSSVAELQMASDTMSDAIDETGNEVRAAASATEATSQDMISVADATEGLTGAIGENPYTG